MDFNEFQAALHDGRARREGMYWAMYSGGDSFQQGMATLLSPPSVLQSLDLNSWCHPSSNASDASDLTLWITPSGHTEQLHYDGYDNLHFQLIGTKRWRLWPPTVKFPVNPIFSDDGNAGPNFATIKIEDAERDFGNEEIVIDVHPGEAIFVPAGYWHCVSGLSSPPSPPSSEKDHLDIVVSVNLFQPPSLRPLSNRLAWNFLRLEVDQQLASAKEWWRVWRGTDPPVVYVNAPPERREEEEDVDNK
jgi:hypothetical protein